ncbi:MAG: hypothetical protein LBC45_01300 [Chlamydiales bacterium]|jgi:hypothetical protein|nr:hypothetical protein [Chlamydiales bacterium]
MGNAIVVESFAADDRLCFAVEKVPNKAVEKSTWPILLKQVDVKGAILLGDSHFCAIAAYMRQPKKPRIRMSDKESVVC